MKEIARKPAKPAKRRFQYVEDSGAEREGFEPSVPVASTPDRKSDAFLRGVFDSQFDSHGLGQGWMKGTGAEIVTRDLARFGRAQTRFNRTFTSVTRVQIPSGTPRLFASSRRLTATFDSHGIRDKENGVMEVVVAGDGEQDRGDRRGSSQPDAASKSVRSANAKGGLFIWAFVSAARRY